MHLSEVALEVGRVGAVLGAGLTLAPFAAGTAIGAVVATTVLVPRIGWTALQLAAAVIAVGAWWLYHTISVHGLATSSVDLIPAQLVLGIGTGMIVAPLFDFILAAVTNAEVGSASGVVNTMQQLGGAVGVAVLGTVFFSVLGREGFTVAIEHCLLIELGIAPVLALLAALLPYRPRDPEALPADQAEHPELVSPAAA